MYRGVYCQGGWVELVGGFAGMLFYFQAFDGVSFSDVEDPFGLVANLECFQASSKYEGLPFMNSAFIG